MTAQKLPNTLAMLTTELSRVVSTFPKELTSIPFLFDKQGSFIGAETLFIDTQPPDNTAQTPTDSLTVTVDSLLASTDKSTTLLTTISIEEHQSVLEKMKELLEYPAGQLDQQSELYLEQQLSDIVGFEVTNELENQRMLYTTGKVKALPHLKRHPQDVASAHTKYTYAGMQEKRSSFGWFMDQGTVTDTLSQVEKYYMSLQLYYLPQWQQDHKQLKTWYKHRKLLVINPYDQLAVVCAVGSIGPSIPFKYQFGASPETILEGKLWSREARGRALVLFVDDPTNKVPLGPVSLQRHA